MEQLFISVRNRVAVHGPQLLHNYPGPLPSIRLQAAGRVSISIKFWEATATSQGLRLRWGLYGRAGQSVLIPLLDCVAHNPVQELMNRCQKKIKEGYQLEEAFCP